MSRGPRYTVVSSSPLTIHKDGRVFGGGQAIAVIMADIALDERERAREQEALRTFPRDLTFSLRLVPDLHDEEAEPLTKLHDLLEAIKCKVPRGEHCWIEMRRRGEVVGKGEYWHIAWQGEVLEMLQESGEVLGLALAINATYQQDQPQR